MATKAKKLAKYSDLQEIIGKELPINAARVKFIVLLITALIKVQSVNYERLAQGFDNPVELSSNLRRIQRFFAKFALESDLIARLLFKLWTLWFDIRPDKLEIWTAKYQYIGLRCDIQRYGITAFMDIFRRQTGKF